MKERNAALEKTERKKSFFDQMQETLFSKTSRGRTSRRECVSNIGAMGEFDQNEDTFSWNITSPKIVRSSEREIFRLCLKKIAS